MSPFQVTQPAITCSKLTLKTPERRVFIVNFEQVNVDWGKGNGIKTRGFLSLT